jgi:hypothetical protein
MYLMRTNQNKNNELCAAGVWKLAVWIWKSATRIWKLVRRIMTHNPQIIITVKLMVKMKKLFWVKDFLGPCLEDVHIEYHLPLCGKTLYQIHHLYSASGGYKSKRRKGSPSKVASHYCRDSISCVRQERRTRS